MYYTNSPTAQSDLEMGPDCETPTATPTGAVYLRRLLLAISLAILVVVVVWAALWFMGTDELEPLRFIFLMFIVFAALGGCCRG